MRAILIDDEVHCISTLSWSLREYCPSIEIVATGSNGLEGIALIREHKPDLVFLDIEMPVLNGLDMLQAIEVINFKVIFTTAYNHYAVKAIKLSAVDYLLKPVDKDELIVAVEKAKNTISIEPTEEKMKVFKHNLKVNSSLQKILVPTTEGILFFDINSIVHFEAQSNYTMMYFDNGTKILASKTLKDYEDLLPDDIFFRCHNSHIINMRHIKRYIRGDGGFIELSSGREVELSRRKKSEFMEKIGI